LLGEFGECHPGLMLARATIPKRIAGVQA
jgi:hypothetical protein